MQTATPNTAVKSDVVTRYLAANGFTPQVERFGNSDFIIGMRIQHTDFELVYRFENEELIVCDFVNRSKENQNNRAVAGFIKLIHQLERAVPHIRQVRGMLLHSVYAEVTALRERLATVLIAQGANWQQVEGDSWLVYPNKNCSKKLPQSQ